MARSAPPPPTFQALIVSAPDPLGNRVTTLYDSASGRATTTPVPQNGEEPRFGRADRIAYLLPPAVMSVDPATSAQHTEAGSPTLLASSHAWARDGSLAYIGVPSARSGGASELTIRSPSGRQVSVALPASVTAARLRFSPDSRFLLLASAATLEVVRRDGSVALRLPAAAGASPTDATWSGDGTLYYWDARGVNAVMPGGGDSRTVLPGVHWSDPDASPDGRHVVFETSDAQGLPRLQLLDTATGDVVHGFSLVGESHARFVSPTEIWFHDEVLCDGCGTLTAPANDLLSYDLVQRSERPTGLSGFVADVRTSNGG